MDTNKKWIVIIGVIVVLVFVFIFWGMSDQKASNLGNTVAFDQSIKDSVIEVDYTSTDFGLAINPSQILLDTDVSPCDTTLETGFDYCLFYKGDEVEGGDFESAGMRIKNRPDLVSENSCLSTPPRGVDVNLAPNTLKPQAEVSTSLFKDLSSSGEDYVSMGSLYRLFYKDTSKCYEFETKINHKSDNPEELAPNRVVEQRTELNGIFENMLDKVVVVGEIGDIFP